MQTYSLTKASELRDYKHRAHIYPILITSYEMATKLATQLAAESFDILVRSSRRALLYMLHTVGVGRGVDATRATVVEQVLSAHSPPDGALVDRSRSSGRRESVLVDGEKIQREDGDGELVQRDCQGAEVTVVTIGVLTVNHHSLLYGLPILYTQVTNLGPGRLGPPSTVCSHVFGTIDGKMIGHATQVAWHDMYVGIKQLWTFTRFFQIYLHNVAKLQYKYKFSEKKKRAPGRASAVAWPTVRT